MKTFHKKIFSENALIEIKPNNEKIVEALYEQLSYYEDFAENEKVTLKVIVANNFDHLEIKSKNPSVHSEINNGFIINSTNYKTAFYFENSLLTCEIYIKPSGGFPVSYLRKINNIEFATREERIAQIVFEGVLLPAMFFIKDKILIHSSGIKKEDKAILIGGAGGSGKTSLEIELCFNKKFEFINDDIAVVNESGNVFPNLAYPKIYGYNLKNNKKLRKSLFASRTIGDLTHWKIKALLFGEDKVRRKLVIRNNYNYGNTPAKISKYFILIKEKIDKISVEKISPQKAAQMHLQVIWAEFWEFINHIRWHEFNMLAEGKKPIITFEELKKSWYEKSTKIFAEVENFVVKIPLNIEHQEFLSEISKIIIQ